MKKLLIAAAVAAAFAASSLSAAAADPMVNLRMSYGSCVITLEMWQDATKNVAGTRHSVKENENYYSDLFWLNANDSVMVDCLRDGIATISATGRKAKAAVPGVKKILIAMGAK